MAGRLPSSNKDPNRKLKAHRKSRRGCGNCKLRRVKCDERKPKCQKCTSFSVLCSYDSQSSDLQPSFDGATNMGTLQILPYTLKQTVSSIITPSLRLRSTGSPNGRDAIYDFQMHDMELLKKFQTRTVFTITTDQNLHLYQKQSLQLAHSHPFLMHALLSLTLMHDRYLSAMPNTKLTTLEAFHWYQGVALFNSKIAGRIEPSERHAVYATAVCLGVIAFFYIEAQTPEEAWPLKPPSPLDLNWLSLSDGKKELGRDAQPRVEYRTFQSLSPFEITKPKPTTSTVPGLEVLPPQLIQLCRLDASSAPEENPYHAVATALTKSLHSNCKLTTILTFLSLISNFHPGYKHLLRLKDPTALLLLAYWFAKMCEFPHWWITRRAALAGQAICLYLQRWYGDDGRIQEALRFPEMMCGGGAA